ILVVQEVAMQPLTQDLLHSTDCYIVDQGGFSVLVWKGKEASIEERRSALGRAVGFIKAKNYSSSTNVEVMAEGGESAMFKQLFISWTEKGQTKGLGNSHTYLLKLAVVFAQIWRIEDLELRELHPGSFGQFYGGDCYLVLYTYKRANKLQYILYMWQGRHATQDEITACAYQAVAIDNKYSGVPVQVRVVMGKEPRHFLAIFKGKLIIFEGGTGRAGVTNPGPGARLFQVRGTHEMNTRATEVPARSSSLNTNDVFLLKTDHIIYLWYGKVLHCYLCYGKAIHCYLWYGKVRHCYLWYLKVLHCYLCYGKVLYCYLWYGKVLYCYLWYGKVRHCYLCYGKVRHCYLWYFKVLYCYLWYGKVRHCYLCYGTVRHCYLCYCKVRHCYL
uniref:Gelsolin-like domain-containing protein n=1 Tax=Hucho hucho TaxID=62062 RepID=A0A4W5JNN6_9TELE